MNKADVTKVVKKAQQALSKRSPEILIAIGIAGMATSTVLAVRATPKALKLIEAENRDLTKLEVVKVAWKPYIPAAISCATSIACLVGASSVHVKRNAALATAYKLSETALNEFKEKAIETVGEKKVKEIKERIVEDKIEKNPVSKTEVLITGSGNTLCCELAFDRYFRSDRNKIERAENNLNRQMLSENSISLTDFYVELGIKPTSTSDMLGWNLDKPLKIEFSSCLADDGTPCLAFDYKYPPVYDFYKYY